jgi:hypothetical protein
MLPVPIPFRMTAPTGSLSSTVKVRVPSTFALSTMTTVIAWFTVPAVKVSVPETAR